MSREAGPNRRLLRITDVIKGLIIISLQRFDLGSGCTLDALVRSLSDGSI